MCPAPAFRPSQTAAIALDASPASYRLEIHAAGETRVAEDPYRFGSPLGDVDRYLIGEGTHLHLHEVLGARLREVDGVTPQECDTALRSLRSAAT